MVYQLQSNQLTIGQFSSSIISFIAPLVIDYIDRDFPWLINDKGSAPYRTSALYIGICLQLLECAVQLLELEEMSSACKQHDESKLKVGYLNQVYSGTSIPDTLGQIKVS